MAKWDEQTTIIALCVAFCLAWRIHRVIGSLKQVSRLATDRSGSRLRSALWAGKARVGVGKRKRGMTVESQLGGAAATLADEVGRTAHLVAGLDRIRVQMFGE